jgi:polysaccharide pyruvyl transferase WcaK-like protein
MTGPTKVGLFGLLGSGNSGNQASTESVLAYLRRCHPEAEVDAMSAGFGWVADNYGIAAIPLSWQEKYEHRPRGRSGIFRKILSKLVDPIRIIRWVRRHDVVIVPGMGVLEATLPLHAWGFPLTMFTLSAAGRACHVKVALVSVGASVIRQRATRQLLVGSARLAYYRSFRDEYSKDAMRQQGLDTTHDRVFPDLVFAFETPPHDPGDQRLVALGVMDYHGSNDDLARADELHAAYLEQMTSFAGWLLDNGYRIRFFGGDDSCDYAAADEIIARLQGRPVGNQAAGSLTAGSLTADSVTADSLTVARFTKYTEMLDQMNQAGTVVATRFHNVLAGLLLGKPTLAIGYSHKFVDLMASTGLPEFVQPAHELDAAELIVKFKETQARRDEIVAQIRQRNAAKGAAVTNQFAQLSTVLFPSRGK